MSTCLSCPLASFFTFTLQAVESKSTELAAAMTNAENLFLPMFRPSAGDVNGTLQACATLRDIRNAHRKMPANCNFSKQRLDRAYLRNRRVGKRTHVILNLREVCRKIRISHGDHGSFLRGTIQQL